MSILRESEILVWAPMNIGGAPETLGVYTLRGPDGNVGYVGSALKRGGLRSALMQHWVTRDQPLTQYFHWVECPDEGESEEIERDMIARYRPPWNMR